MSDQKFKRLSKAIDGFVSVEELKTLRSTEWSHGTFKEFAFAIQKAAARQLHPMRSHVYARDTWLRDENRKKLQLGIKIDGLRNIAERSGEFAGQKGPFWFDASGEKYEIWLQDDHPAAAMVEVLRHDHEVATRGIARWDDYAPYKKNGDLFHMWANMGPHMLAKCAEANAHRKAFSQIGDVYIDVEMHQDRPDARPSGEAQQSAPSDSTSKEQKATDQLLGGGSGDGAPSVPEEGSDSSGGGEPLDPSAVRSENGEGRTSGETMSGEEQQQAREATAQRAEQNGAPEATISDAQENRLWAIAKDAEEGQAYSEEALRAMIQSEFGYQVAGEDREDSISDLRREDYDQVIEACRDAGLASRYRAPGTADMFGEGGAPDANGETPLHAEITEEYGLSGDEQAAVQQAIETVRAGLDAESREDQIMLASQYLSHVEDDAEHRREAVVRACKEFDARPIPDDFPHRDRLTDGSLYTLQGVHRAMRNDALGEISGIGESRAEEIVQAIGHYDFEVLPETAPTAEPNDEAFAEGVEDEEVPI
jgi:phage recombination protein Bet